MCVTSFVSDYYRPRDNDKTRTWVMNQPIPTVIQYDPEAKELLRKAVELLDKLDKRIGDTDCKDELKKKFLEFLETEAG